LCYIGNDDIMLTDFGTTVVIAVIYTVDISHTGVFNILCQNCVYSLRGSVVFNVLSVSPIRLV